MKKQKLIVLGGSTEELRASASSAQAESAGEVTSSRMVFYSGAPVYRYDWFSDTEYMLRFDMSAKAVDFSRMANAPVLADHWRSVDRQVGVIDKAWLEGGKGYAEYRLAETPDTESIRQKVAEGIIRQVSMDAVVLESEDVTPKKSRIKEFLATKWQPQAVALVPVGADPGAQLLSEEDPGNVWLAEGIYQPRTNLSEAGTANKPQSAQVIQLLLLRRKLLAA